MTEEELNQQLIELHLKRLSKRIARIGRTPNQNKWVELTRDQQNELVYDYIVEALLENDEIKFTRAKVGEWWDAMEDEEERDSYLPRKEEPNGQPM